MPRHLVFKVPVLLIWWKVSGEKQWALLIHSRMYHIIHCWTFSLLWARAVFYWMCSLCRTARGTTPSSLCRTVFRKLQCLWTVTLSGSRWEVSQQWPDDIGPNVDAEVGLVSTFVGSLWLIVTRFECFWCWTCVHTLICFVCPQTFM